MTKVLDARIEDAISLAAALITQGELVAFPTETVYGIGASVENATSIQNIFTVKGRPADNPLIAHIYDLHQVETLAKTIPPCFWQLAEVFCPGPLAFVLEKKESIPSIVSAGLRTIAFRLPSHPVARALLELAKVPIVAPSANLSGRPSPVQAMHVLEDLGGKIPLILDGGSVPIGIESTVLSLCDPKKPMLLRPGIITKEQIEEVLGCHVSLAPKDAKVASPGMKYRHYAPKAKVHLFFSPTTLKKHLAQHPETKRMIVKEVLGSNLYAKLRLADYQRCAEVCILVNQSTRENAALMDRLQRAST